MTDISKDPGTAAQPFAAAPLDRGIAERAALLRILTALYFVYVGSSAGLICSNDGSHFATTRALCTRGALSLGDEELFALCDVAFGTDGRRFAAKPPGTALVAVPFYCVGRLLDGFLARPVPYPEILWFTNVDYPFATKELGLSLSLEEYMGRYSAERPAQDCCNLTSALAGVLGCLISYRIARDFGVSIRSGLCLMVLVGLGTLQWRYSTVLFSHVLSGAILLIQVYWIMKPAAWKTAGAAFGFGLLTGFSVAVEYQAALSIPILLGYQVWKRRNEIWQRAAITRVALCVLGIGCVGLAMGAYHYWCFGSPFRTPFAAARLFPYLTTLSGTFGGSAVEGAKALLFSPETSGLLFVCPFAALAPFGWFFARRADRAAMVMILMIVAVHAWAMFTIVMPSGGRTQDHRYLVRIIPLILIPFGLLLDRSVKAARRNVPIAIVTAVCLAAMSIWTFFHSLHAIVSFIKHLAWLPTTWQPHLRAGIVDWLMAAFPSIGHWRFFAVAALVYAVFVAIFCWCWKETVSSATRH